MDLTSSLLNGGLWFLPEMIYHYALAFFGALIIGEEVLFLLSIFSGKGYFSLYAVIFLGFLGLLSADIFWYFIGKHGRIREGRKKLIKCSGYRELHKFGKFLDERHEFLGFFLSKFVYGIRFLKLVSSGAKEMRFWRFLKLDILALIAWMIIMIPLGFLAGRGFLRIFEIVHGIEGAVKVLVIGLFIIILLNLIARRLIIYFGKKLVKNK
jgi:membrane protein DedA with SNARE-associated domain